MTLWIQNWIQIWFLTQILPLTQDIANYYFFLQVTLFLINYLHGITVIVYRIGTYLLFWILVFFLYWIFSHLASLLIKTMGPDQDAIL
jgi:hypothetical protein